MKTLNEAQQTSIASYFADRHIPKGLGTSEEACSIAGINLALSGRLTDEVPECMSLVIGKWIVRIQDAMPDDIRNSAEWRRLLPLAAGTGRDKEPERLALIRAWMWDALALIKPDDAWREPWERMLREKTPDAADAADAAAYAADAAARAAYAAYAAYAADAAAYAADAADAAARAANAAYAAYAARAANAAAYAANAAAWQKINPVTLLAALVEE